MLRTIENYQAIRTELDDDPLTRGYAGISDAEAATDMRIVNRKLDRDTMTGTEYCQAINNGEWAVSPRSY